MDVYHPAQDIMRILTENVFVMSVYSILTNPLCFLQWCVWKLLKYNNQVRAYLKKIKSYFWIIWKIKFIISALDFFLH